VTVWLTPVIGKTSERLYTEETGQTPALSQTGPAAQTPTPPQTAPKVPPSPSKEPECFGSAAYGPEIKEPLLTPGPTELVSGFYLDGGPLVKFSAPGCKRPEPSPEAGTVEVMNPSGEVVATQTSEYGHFVEIPLPAGFYTITGTFLWAEFCTSEPGGTIDCVHPKETRSIVIPAGYTVRRDFTLGIP
jgi:hypothetical protein